MTIFILGSSDKPSGGTKVLNQVVNLFIQKGYDSKFVVTEDVLSEKSFMKNPAPIITFDEFKKNCKKEDIIINFWMSKKIHDFVKQCDAHLKVFWHHGIVLSKYSNFNAEELYRSKAYNQYWNVSRACADYISKKYKINDVKIVHPFFDDETMNEYLNKTTGERDGILILRRRGQEIIPDIIKSFPDQKITILNRVFSDEKLYSELTRHKYFVSTDKGITKNLLIRNKYYRLILMIRRALTNTLKKKKENGWINQKQNLLGFPMTACEAGWLGTAVIGFAMGGGLEWMSDNNMYLAQDNNPDSLIQKIREATEQDEATLNKKIALAHEAVKKFNQKNTWEQMSKNLNLTAQKLN